MDPSLLVKPLRLNPNPISLGVIKQQARILRKLCSKYEVKFGKMKALHFIAQAYNFNSWEALVAHTDASDKLKLPVSLTVNELDNNLQAVLEKNFPPDDTKPLFPFRGFGGAVFEGGEIKILCHPTLTTYWDLLETVSYENDVSPVPDEVLEYFDETDLALFNGLTKELKSAKYLKNNWWNKSISTLLAHATDANIFEIGRYGDADEFPIPLEEYHLTKLYLELDDKHLNPDNMVNPTLLEEARNIVNLYGGPDVCLEKNSDKLTNIDTIYTALILRARECARLGYQIEASTNNKTNIKSEKQNKKTASFRIAESIAAYIQSRALVEGVKSDLSGEFLQPVLDKGVRQFFGLNISPGGEFLIDHQEPEPGFMKSWVELNKSNYPTIITEEGEEMKNQTEQEQIVEATKVKPEQQTELIDSIFGNVFRLVIKNVIWSIASSICADYNSGLWDFYKLSNGGMFIAPVGDDDKKYSITVEGNGYTGEVSPEAFGIICCMMAYSHLSFHENEQLGGLCGQHYHLLYDLALNHKDARQIFSAID